MVIMITTMLMIMIIEPGISRVGLADTWQCSRRGFPQDKCLGPGQCCHGHAGDHDDDVKSGDAVNHDDDVNNGDDVISLEWDRWVLVRWRSFRDLSALLGRLLASG